MHRCWETMGDAELPANLNSMQTREHRLRGQFPAGPEHGHRPPQASKLTDLA